jgi:hypothetical protein
MKLKVIQKNTNTQWKKDSPFTQYFVSFAVYSNILEEPQGTTQLLVNEEEFNSCEIMQEYEVK